MRAVYLGAALLLVAAPVQAFGQFGGGMPGGGGQQGGGMPGGGGGRHGGMRGGGQDGQRGGERPAMMKPIKRDRFDKEVEALFREADTNHDGIVTLEELRASIEVKRDAMIRARFDRIDTNHDKTIQFAEFVAWQKSMGDVALDENQPIVAEGAVPDAIAAPGKGGSDEDREVRRLVGELDALTLTKANTNYDSGVSLEELLAYENARFDAMDTDHDGELSPEELRAARGGRGGRGAGRPGGTGGPPGAPPPGQ